MRCEIQEDKSKKTTSAEWSFIYANLWTIGFQIVILVNVSGVDNVTATCTKPTLGENTYTLSENKLLYGVNETYEIFCAPGYTTSGKTSLICQSSGSWSSDSPTCTNAEGTYPWWMLLVAVLLVVLLISCILPRLIQFCCMKKNNEKKPGEERNNLQRTEEDMYGDDYEDNLARAISPVPNFGKDRKSNIDFMSDLYKDADLSNLKRANKNTRF